MKKHSKQIASVLGILLSASLLIMPVSAQDVKTVNKTETQAVQTLQYKQINPHDMVNSPANYLHKKVKVVATFDKFSTLGLDYKPAFRDSQKYISFLIKRQDVNDHTIPLSELKLLITREKAEKLIDIESGDKIEFTGEVFSTALNDPWIEVNEVKILTPKDNKDKKASVK